MRRIRLLRLRWWGWVGVVVALALLYLVALSVIPALFGGDESGADPARARGAITAENWSLVVPEEREELAKAIDEAWRALTAYRQVYRSGTPAELDAGMPTVQADSVFNLTRDGRVAAQQDVNVTSAAAPGSGGRDMRSELYRILTDRPYVNTKGSKVGDSELIYQQSGGVWGCTRDIADKRPIPAPSLRLEEAGDGGFGEIDGHRVRAFVLPVGAFGLRWPATVWVDTESFLVRRQEIESAVKGQREVWTYDRFDEVNEITPPSGITCIDT
ncbi:MAG: hypothetical protein ACRDJE_06770 [Dehalococcoidia bacterium]